MLFGHVFGLFIPIGVYEAMGISPASKQMLAIIFGGIGGLLALIGGTIFVYRKLEFGFMIWTLQFYDLILQF